MKQIHFVVNPISGSGKHKISKQFLCKYFNYKKYDLVIKHTQFTGHATELTQDSIKEKADIIVACGGDGTINEVASCLVKKDIPLGIIPVGSGNGLASNLAISRNIKKALNTIKNESIKKIDVGQINTKYFFSNTGFGFDADVIFNYEQMEKRCFSTYLKAVIKSYRNYNSYENVEIHSNNQIQIIRPFMIFISNSNEMGYKMSLTPEASLEDGLLDVIVIPKINKFKMLLLGFLLLIKKIQLLKEVKSFRTQKLILKKKPSNYFLMQKDGEPHSVESNKLMISLFKKSLCVIAP